MTDPFAVLARPPGRTDPDPEFRARLMSRVREELTAGDMPDEMPTTAASDSACLVEGSEPSAPHRRRLLLAAAAVITVFLAGGLIALAANREDSQVVETDAPTTSSADVTIPPPASSTAPPLQLPPVLVPIDVLWPGKTATLIESQPLFLPGCTDQLPAGAPVASTALQVQPGGAGVGDATFAYQWVVTFDNEDQARAVMAAARAAPSCPPSQINLPRVPVYDGTARVGADSAGDDQDFIALIVNGGHTRSVSPLPTDDLGAIQLVRHGRHIWVAIDTAYLVAKRDYAQAATDATRRLATLP